MARTDTRTLKQRADDRVTALASAAARQQIEDLDGRIGEIELMIDDAADGGELAAVSQLQVDLGGLRALRESAERRLARALQGETAEGRRQAAQALTEAIDAAEVRMVEDVELGKQAVEYLDKFVALLAALQERGAETLTLLREASDYLPRNERRRWWNRWEKVGLVGAGSLGFAVEGEMQARGLFSRVAGSDVMLRRVGDRIVDSLRLRAERIPNSIRASLAEVLKGATS